VEEGVELVAGAVGARIARDVERRPVQLRGAERSGGTEAAIDGVEGRAIAFGNGEAIGAGRAKITFAAPVEIVPGREAASGVLSSNPHGL